MTVAGEDEGSPCIFPFRYEGETYIRCADWAWGGDYHGEEWCSTQVSNMWRGD